MQIYSQCLLILSTISLAMGILWRVSTIASGVASIPNADCHICMSWRACTGKKYFEIPETWFPLYPCRSSSSLSVIPVVKFLANPKLISKVLCKVWQRLLKNHDFQSPHLADEVLLFPPPWSGWTSASFWPKQSELPHKLSELDALDQELGLLQHLFLPSTCRKPKCLSIRWPPR